MFKKIFLKKRLKLICFDIDNTLINYGTAESDAEVHISELLSKKLRVKTIDVLRAFTKIKNRFMHKDTDPKSCSRKMWVEKTLELLNVKEELKKKINTAFIEKEYWDYLINHSSLFPNTLKVLDFLKSSGKYKIACLTDSDGDKEIKLKRLKHFNIYEYFDYIITTDDTGKNKPSIENWDYVLRISGLKGSECMMVGDHPEIDLINAKAKGFTTVWTKEYIKSDSHFKYVDYEINEIGELLKIIR
ncbi:MAG: 2-haloalkanoic acid dehalogenase [Candidatus Woesearchaeota archaeon]|nr:MAG: 2-haloalkanoic acid dehalogenase [Candidatus Woesearchaeota archaeon]